MRIQPIIIKKHFFFTKVRNIVYKPSNNNNKYPANDM